jgi:hypothetical protein
VSVEIPDQAYEVGRAKAAEVLPLLDGIRRDPATHAILDAAAPAILGDRVEAVARALCTAASGLEDAFDRVGPAQRQDALNTAAEVLGLPVSPDGKDDGDAA